MAGISIYLVDLTKQFSVRMIFTFFHTAHVLVKTLLSRNFYGEIKECVVFTLGQLYQDMYFDGIGKKIIFWPFLAHSVSLISLEFCEKSE